MSLTGASPPRLCTIAGFCVGSLRPDATLNTMRDPLAAQGVTQSASLLKLGWSKHKIAAAVARGSLVRIRRGWVARPNADPLVLEAARFGVLIGCVTQAERLGLWRGAGAEARFCARSGGAKLRPAGVMHWATPLVPREVEAIEDSIENVLNTVAHCQPFEEAVAIWDSALNKRLVEWGALGRLSLAGAARAVHAASSMFADSGLESYVRLRLAWLKLRVVPQAWVHGHRVDFLIGQRLILQIDGAQHIGAQRTRDDEHDARVALLGFSVVRVTYAQVMGDWPAVQQRIMVAIGQGAHLA